MNQMIDATVAVSTASALIYFRDKLFRQLLPQNIRVNLMDPSIQKPLVPSVYSSKFICITVPLMSLILILTQQIVPIFLFKSSPHLSLHLVMQMLNYKMIICFITGYSVTLMCVLLVKSMVGRKRPNFLASNGIQVDPVTGYVTVEGYRINNLVSSSDAIDEVILLHAKLHPQKQRSLSDNLVRATFWKVDSLRSFYSGHSCVPVYCSIFTILHLQSILINYNLPVTSLQIILETIYLLLSLHPGITQALTFHHNWSDVAMGHSVGAVTAFLAFFYFS